MFIDPPYNTGGGDFLYKDTYQHSSWLAMMVDRLATAPLEPETTPLRPLRSAAGSYH